MPIITFCWSSIRAWMAASPNRLASIRSLALEPHRVADVPEWKLLHHIRDIPFYPVGIVHGTSIFILGTFGHNDDTAVFFFLESTSDKCLQLVHIRFVLRNNGSFSPEAIALSVVLGSPHHVPSPRQRKCGREVAVSLILSTHSTIVFNAVSYPMVESVPYKSLSIVPGSPIHVTLYSSAKIRAPRQRTVSTDNNQCTDIFFCITS